MRAKIKTIKKKPKYYSMKLKRKNMKLFFNQDGILDYKDENDKNSFPMYNGMILDEFYFRTYQFVDDPDTKGLENLPNKNDVVYFFISRLEKDEAKEETFFRVQYIVRDSGEVTLRQLMKAASKTELDCSLY